MLIKPNKNILIVLVLYNELLENSETFKSLIKESSNIKSKYEIVIYDNSKLIRSDLSFLKEYEVFFNFNYVSNDLNPGISSAYNYAFNLASKKQFRWLLLLDQDTKLPVNYIQKFIKTVDYSNSSIVAYVPRIQQENSGKPISPFKINSYGKMSDLSKDVKGVIDYNVIAINSGAFINVDFLLDIGGFSQDYPLDMLDFWLFSTIFEKEKCIYVLNIDIMHDLSVLDFQNNVSLNRYESILMSEKRFFYSRRKWKYFYKIRLIKRLFNQVGFKNKSFFNKTLKYIFK